MVPLSSQESGEAEPGGETYARRPGPPAAPAPLLLNRQRAIQGDWGEVREFLARLSKRLAPPGFSVCLLSDRAIRRYNRQFRNRDEATDVLSFPAGDGLAAPGTNRKETDRHGSCPGSYLGDILISAETARENAKRYGLRVEQEVQVLALHGLLHLLGEDHERDHGRMARLERTWRLQLGLPRSLTERSRRALRASAGCGRRKSLPDRRP